MVTPWGFESPLSHQKTEIPIRVSQLFYAREGTRKAGGSVSSVKTVLWTVFSPWESPSDLRRIPEGCGSIRNMSDAGKDWYGVMKKL